MANEKARNEITRINCKRAIDIQGLMATVHNTLDSSLDLNDQKIRLEIMELIDEAYTNAGFIGYHLAGMLTNTKQD